jgi:S1-C subfamily serine protease
MKNRFLIAVAMVAASAIVGGATAYGVVRANFSGSSASGQTTQNRTTYLTTEDFPDLTYAAETAVDAVVSVIKSSEIPQLNLWRGGIVYREQLSGGSGVIISPDGYIVTNHHVVVDANKLTVKLPNSEQNYDARLVGTDPDTEIALIKIEGRDLPYLNFGSSDSLRLGEWVLAIGNPYELHSTVTAGIVSAKARTLGAIRSEVGGMGIESFIQTDAAVNPGHSGGALVNTRGGLVGINTLIKSPTGSFAGYSFAVPETIVQKIVTDLKEFGEVRRAVMGIAYSVVEGEVVVQQVVPKSAAEAAGIRTGDAIVSIDGDPIHDAAALVSALGLHRPGDTIKLEIKRDGKVKQIEVVLRNRTITANPK